MEPEEISLNMAMAVINHGVSIGKPINNLQLQAILWSLHCEHLKQTGRYVLKEKFEAWQQTPVLRSVWSEYIIYGNEPITVKQNNKTGLDELDQENLPEIFERCSKVPTAIIYDVFYNENAYKLTELKKKISTELITDCIRKIGLEENIWIKTMKRCININVDKMEPNKLKDTYVIILTLLNYLPMTNSVKDEWYKEERSKLIKIFNKVKEEYEGRQYVYKSCVEKRVWREIWGG